METTNVERKGNDGITAPKRFVGCRAHSGMMIALTGARPSLLQVTRRGLTVFCFGGLLVLVLWCLENTAFQLSHFAARYQNKAHRQSI